MRHHLYDPFKQPLALYSSDEFDFRFVMLIVLSGGEHY